MASVPRAGSATGPPFQPSAGDVEDVLIAETSLSAPAAAKRRPSVEAARALFRAHSLALSAAIWLVLVVNFSVLRLGGSDEKVQYGFVERLFGDARGGSGYLFGLSLVETPFYAVGKVLGALGLHSVAGRPVTQLAIALGLGLLTVALWPLVGSILRGLELPHPGFALLAGGVGMPLLFYATIQPAKSHALEAVVFGLALYLAFRLFRGDGAERWPAYGLGATLGLLFTVRYFDAGAGIGLVLALACLRRFRDAVQVSAGGVVAALLLGSVPFALGAGFSVTTFEAGGGGHLETHHGAVSFAPGSPVRMLFTDERGLFLWSPVSALAVVGLVHLFRSRPRDRGFLVAACAMGGGVLAMYSLTVWWLGSVAFSQRFLTVLTPLLVIGLAGLFDAAPRLGVAAAAACATWTLVLMLNFITLGGPPLTPGGATDLIRVPWRMHVSPGAYQWGVRNRSNLLRWTSQ